MPWAAAAAIGGALISSQGAKKASSAQSKSADRSLALQKSMFDTQMGMGAGTRRRGERAAQELDMLMGLSGGVSSSREDLMKQYAEKFTTYTKRKKKKKKGFGAGLSNAMSGGSFASGVLRGVPGKGGYNAHVDEGALNHFVNQQMTKLEHEATARRNDPRFGMMNKKFDAAALQEDEGYKFRRGQGQLGVERSAAARGGILSGQALKGMQRFSQDFGSKEFGIAHSRDAAMKADMYNRLSGISKSGMVASQGASQAAGTYGRSAGDTYTQQGNAMAAGYQGQAQAMNQGISGALQGWQDYKARQGTAPKKNYSSSKSYSNTGGFV